MFKIKNTKIISKLGTKSAILVLAVVASFALVGVPIVQALSSAELAEKAKLEARIKKQEAEKDDLSEEASSIEEKVDRLQAKIGALEVQIKDAEERMQAIQGEINEAQAELDRQKEILGENIKASYLEGEISTLEMLASSKDLSDFVDKQQYRSSVQDKIKTTLEEITALKFKLRAQKEEVGRYLADKEKAQNQIAAQKAEQNELLGLNEEQQNALNAKIKQNSKRVAELNQKQVNENLASLGGSIPSGMAGGGGYKYGNAVCLWPGWADPPCRQYDWGYPKASAYRRLWDEWSYGYRNCTSWAAYRVSKVKGYTPAGLSGLGHAKYWPDRTSARVDRNPSGGVVVGVTNGTYGHVRFVEGVGADGSILVSDYNLGGDGAYRKYKMEKSRYQNLGMRFIHF